MARRHPDSFPSQHSARRLLIWRASTIAVGIVCLACRRRVPRNAVVRFARHWYPLPLYIFFFEELEGWCTPFSPSWFDRWLIAFDYNFAGVHPSVWLARFASPALNDFMQFAYMTYFLYS